MTAAAAQASTLLGVAGGAPALARSKRADVAGSLAGVALTWWAGRRRRLVRSGADPAPDNRPSPRARLGPAAGSRGRRKLPADAGRRRERALAPAGKRGEPPRGPFARRAVPVAFPAARALPCEHRVL